MTEQTEFDFSDTDLEAMTRFKPIIERYIHHIAIAGEKMNYDKACAIEALTNLAEILDGRYSPDIFPCLDVKSWGQVNRGEVNDYNYKYTDNDGTRK